MRSHKIAFDESQPFVTAAYIQIERKFLGFQRKRLKLKTRNGRSFSLSVKQPSNFWLTVIFEKFFYFQTSFNGNPLLISRRNFSKQTGFICFSKKHSLESIFRTIYQCDMLSQNLNGKGYSKRSAQKIALKLNKYIKQNSPLLHKQLDGLNSKMIFLQPFPNISIAVRLSPKTNRTLFYISKDLPAIARGRSKSLFNYFNYQTGKEDRVLAIRKVRDKRDYILGHNEFYLLKKLESLTEVVKAYHYFENDTEAGFILEKCDGDIASIFNSPIIQLRTKLNLFSKIVAAVAKIHAKGVIHRDLKENNIIYKIISPKNEAALIKVADFDLACLAFNSRMLKHRVGTSFYMSPECVGKEEKTDPYKMDVWSLGIMLYKIYYDAFPPFSYELKEALKNNDLSPLEQKRIMIKGLKELKAELSKKPDPWQKLIFRALEPEVDKRISLQDLSGALQNL